MNGNLNVAIGQTPANLVGMQSRYDWLEQTLENIREWKLDIFLLPELFLSGYNIGRLVMERAEEEDGHFARCIAKLAKQHSTAICYGFVEKDEEALYNSALCIGADGQLLGKHQKLILPPGFENEHFVTGKQCALFSIGDFKIAILICYDAEFPETCRQVAAAGADVLIVPTALGQRWGIVSEKMIPTRALKMEFLSVTPTTAARKTAKHTTEAVVLSLQVARNCTRKRHGNHSERQT